MAIREVLESARFVVDHKGHRTGVLLDIQTWETLLNWVETIADTKIAIQALNELQAAGGRPQQAGWLNWDEIRGEWGEEEASASTLTTTTSSRTRAGRRTWS